MELRPRSLPPAVSYGAAFYGSLVIGFVQSILLFRILGPAQIGVWLVLYLLMDYGQHFHLGVNNAVNRQLPLLMGAGRGQEAVDYVGRSAGLLVVLSGAWALIAIGAGVLFYRSQPWGAMALSVAVVLEVWLAFALTLLKTHARFGTVGLLLLLRAVLNLALLPLVSAAGLPGAFLRIVIVWAVILAIALAVRPVPVRLLPPIRPGRILAEGFPLLVVGMLFGLQVTVNKVLISAGFGSETVGREYGLAAVVLTLLMVVPSAVGVTSYPAMLRDFGASGRPSILRARVRRQTIMVGAAAFLAAGIGALLLPTVVAWMLPRYAPGLPAALWILPGLVLLSASVPSSYFLQTIRHQRQHVAISLFGLAVQILLALGALGLGGGVVQICQATSLGYAVYATSLYLAFRRAARGVPSAS
jgi:O-antigen/teichoic acid export membrane protein